MALRNSAQPTGLIKEFIAKHAAITPAAIAAECRGRRLTYSELHAQAGALTHHLRQCGVGREVLVGVLMERSVDVVTAIAGILGADAAYLPLDSRAPAERLRWMLEDSGAAAVIVDRQFAELALKLNTTARVIVLDDIVDEGAGSNLYDFDSAAASPDQLAYVIYTSGSTGQPKGVEVLGHSLMHFLTCMQRELDFQPTDTMLAIAPLSFDVAVFELLLPLYCGGRVVILPWPMGADGESLATAIDTYDASVVLATPTTWQLLLDAGWKGSSRLRAVCGGEMMHPALAKRLAPLTRELWNHYGPTETTIAASTYRVAGGEPSVPVGHAIDGIQLFVLDPGGNAVPPGNAGELYIGGIQLARGYRNRVELTTERFVNVGVEGERPVRAYRTGDLVRYDDRDALHFLGRADNQIKIRGYRVELEEIEAVLSLHPDVKQAAVVAEDHSEGDIRLMAFVTARDGAAPDAVSVIDFLAKRLPGYMIPRQVLFVDSLPKTSHGKIDRSTLGSWPLAESNARSTRQSSGDHALESELLAIWRRLPGFESIGINDSFFDFGGHSILAARMMKDVRAKFGMAPPLSALFQSPTVRDLARLICSADAPRPWSPLVAIRAGGSRPPLFCVHGIRGNVLNFEPLARHLPREQPVYGLESRGLNGGTPHRSIEEMARCYIQAMREVQQSGPYLVAGFSAGGVVAFEIARQLRDSGEHVALLGLLDAALYSRPAEAPVGAVAGRGGKLRKFKRCLRRLRTMTPAEIRSALLRNWAHYSQVLAISARARGDALARRCGIPVQGPAKMKDAFLLALRQYRPVTFGGTVVLYRATNGVGRDDERPVMGWDSISPKVVVEMIQAGHPGILSEPAVIAVARSLNQHICEGLALHSRQSRSVLLNTV